VCVRREVSATWFDVRCDTTTTGSGIPLLIKYDSRLRSRADGTVTEVIQASDRTLCPTPKVHECLTQQVCLSQGLRKENVSVPPLPPSRAGLDLATTLERIQQSFVISDPMLPDCPIVFASDNFIEFTGYAHTPARSALRRCTWRLTLSFDRYTREEVLGRNWCAMRNETRVKALPTNGTAAD